jgi:hypothetical protein
MVHRGTDDMSETNVSASGEPHWCRWCYILRDPWAQQMEVGAAAKGFLAAVGIKL